MKSILSFASRCICLVVIAIIGVSCPGFGQIITTIAGDGTNSYTGDGYMATSARIGSIYSIATFRDAVYIGDWDHCVIRKIDTSGIIRLFAGTNCSTYYHGDGGPAISAAILTPYGITFDSIGNCYFTDGRSNIRKIDTNGIISTIAGPSAWGTGTYGFSGDGGPATAAMLHDPVGIKVDKHGNIIFADCLNNRIRKIDTAGIITTIAGNGSFAYSGDGGPATAASFHNVQTLTLDTLGNIYASTQVDNCIRKIDTSGIISTFAGGLGTGYSGDSGLATAAKLYYPWGVETDNKGNIYICDEANYRLRVVNGAGFIYTFAGNGTAGFSGDGGPATSAKIRRAIGLAFNSHNDAFMIDKDNYRIRKITSCWPAAGVSSGASSLCLGDTLVLSGASGGGTWSSGTASVATIDTVGVVTGVGPGIVSINYQVSNYCGTTNTLVNLQVDTFTHAGPISGKNEVCIGDTVTVTDSVAGGMWLSLNPLIATVSAGGLVTGVSAGSDTLLYVVSNACGSDTAFFPIVVKTNAICYASVSSLPKGAMYTLSAFPNPTSGEIQVLLTAPITENAIITVTDVFGRTLAAYTVPGNKITELELRLPAGLYFLSAIVQGEVLQQRLVVD